jgi:GTP-binding protein
MIKIKKVSFLKSSTKIENFPRYSFPEFAFAGRSNTGKSSLINMILGQKGLVKVGSTPGVTRTINFFILNDRISIADLPGFGYAKLPDSVRKKFIPMIKDYIKSRDNLRLVFLLIDIRRTPDDYEKDIIMDLAEAGIPAAIVITKCDKLSKNKSLQNARKIASELLIGMDSVFLSSSETGQGRKEILSLIDDYS